MKKEEKLNSSYNELENLDKNINENLKLEINEQNNELDLEELNLDSLEDLNFDINNLESDNEDNVSKNKEKSDNVKTIIIDTKQNGSNSFDNDRNLEINVDNTSAKKKVYNRYASKKKKDFSFFTDALTE